MSEQRWELSFSMQPLRIEPWVGTLTFAIRLHVRGVCMCLRRVLRLHVCDVFY